MTPRIRSYGVREQAASIGPVGVYLEELCIQGFTVINTDWPREMLDDLKKRLDIVLDQQADEAGGHEALQSIGEANTIRAVLAYDPVFLAVTRHDAVLEICRHIFGSYFILSLQNATINPPDEVGHHQAAFHRDLPYQHFVSTRPLAINALLCLDDFNAETGGTIMLPGSHRVEAFPSDDYVKKMERPAIAAAGQFIVFNSMLYHRAGTNCSKKKRYAINQCYSLPFLKQQISLPSILAGRWSEDANLARFLGYESETPCNVVEWRKLRRERLGISKEQKNVTS